MDANRWSRVNELFDAAYEIAPEAREAYLKQAAAGDDALFREVWSLLHEDQHTHSLLDGVALDAVTFLDETVYEGRRIGPYQIEREIGHGGMGRVFLAHRADGEFEQQVALKLIKRGMDSEAVLRRFRAERQILARLQHPHIARLLDGGLTDEGQPYFAMEYVAGQPIDTYCDAHCLTIDERLALFQDVCRAVLYAHAQLVVHRDLKPSNILVMEDATGRPQVKLLDFGIARVLADDAEGLTQTGAAVMTPEYASPEQVRGEVVSTATDIYSLGVVLYELLAGHRPYAIASRNPVEMAQVVLSTEPERPSTAVERPTKDSTAEAISRARSTVVERLRRRLAGDLDVICLKALRKEVERRYLSVEALAEDVRRHLAGLPVEARPDTASYRLRKFVERHRIGAFTTVGMVLLVSGLVGFYTIRLTQERDRAQLEALKATAVADFLEGIFAVSDPGESKGETVTARALLDEGARRIEDELAGQPEVQAQMMNVMGGVYLKLGLYDDAERLAQQALSIHQEASDGAIKAAAESRHLLGNIFTARGDYVAATPFYEEALSGYRRMGEDAAPDIERIQKDRAWLLYLQGDYPAAESLSREVLREVQARLGSQTPEAATSLENLAEAVEALGNLDEAQRLHEQALSIRRAVYGDLHPDILQSLHNLGEIYFAQGDFDQADSLYRMTLAMSQKLYGEHPRTAISMNNLARVLHAHGRDEEAIRMHKEALAMNRRLLGEVHPEIATGLNNLGIVLRESGDSEAAVPYFQQALAMRIQLLGDVHPHVAQSYHNLAEVLKDLDRFDEAEDAYWQATRLLEQLLPEGHPDLAWPTQGLGLLLMHKGEPARAEPLLRRALSLRQNALPEGHWLTATTGSVLAGCLIAQQRFAEAEPILLESYQHLKTARGEEHRDTVIARERLVELYESWNKPKQAALYRPIAGE